LQHYYDQHGTPLRTFLVSRIAQIEQLGRAFRPIYNFSAKWNLSACLIKHVVGFAQERTIPQLSKRTMKQLVRKKLQNVRVEKPKKHVLLYADEFTNQHEAELGLAFAQLLLRLGYQVTIPDLEESGRAAISKGCLKRAKKIAEENIRRLSQQLSTFNFLPYGQAQAEQLLTLQLVGIEPSAILSFRDEYPDLVPPEMRADAIRIGKNCLLYDEFLKQEIDNGNISAEAFKSDEMEIWLHGHCHQKALVGIEKTVEVLRRLLRGAKVHVIPSGCCGMAGSFGYEKEHYKTSLAIGEMTLFPSVRKIINYQSSIVNSNVPTFVAAPGTSCRQQILDGTGVRAVHPIEILNHYTNK
jgi:Fe-S oxidoreductase